MIVVNHTDIDVVIDYDTNEQILYCNECDWEVVLDLSTGKPIRKNKGYMFAFHKWGMNINVGRIA